MLVNGQSIDIAQPKVTVQNLLEHFNLSTKIVVVEVDEKIVDKTQYSQFMLHDGVKIELVHFVGGG
ncbi:Sulfur carrier protein ThiS [compost metagenome]